MQSHQYGAGTDIGNARENNEDTYVCAVDKELWIVADGMGGLGFGEAASAITAYTVTRMIRQGHGVNQAIEAAHRMIKEYALDEAQGANMGTTLVLLLCQGGVFNVFWVGDSRGYLFNGTLRQITRDHSLVQALIDQGELTEEQALYDPRKNAITKALGVRELETVRSDTVSDRWHIGEKILLCSDGLSDYVAHRDIEQILQQEGSDQDKVDALIAKALAEGGRDNITALLVSAPDSVSKPDSDTEVPNKKVIKKVSKVVDTRPTSVGDTQVIVPGKKTPSNGTQTATQSQLSPALAKRPGEGEKDGGEGHIPGQGKLAKDPQVPSSPAPHEISTGPVYISAYYIRPPRPGTVSGIEATGVDAGRREPNHTKKGLPLRFLLPIAAGILLFLVWTGFPLDQSVVTPLVTLAQDEAQIPQQPPLPEPVATKGLPVPGEGEASVVAEDARAPRPSLTSRQADPGSEPLLQMGVFSRLEGAERTRQNLNQLGLNTRIETRHETEPQQFAVVIGPFRNGEDEANITSVLAREKVAYFRKFSPRQRP